MHWLRKIMWFAAGTAMLFLGNLSATRVPIVGDDFQALQEAFAFSDGDLGQVLAYGWGAGMNAGHFNPIGQLLGALYHFVAFGLSAELHVSPQLFHIASSFTLIWLTVLAASYALVCAARFVRNRDAFPIGRIFALVATIAAITIQIHPWSNDPVTTYSMAGFGSAAVGFLLLALAFRAMSPNTNMWVGTLSVTVVSIFAVLYYEMLVAAVVATAVVYVGAIVPRAERTRQNLARVIALLGFGVVVPALVFLGGRVLAAPASSSNYTGTSVSLSVEAARTWAYSMIGTVPGGAWPYSLYRIDPMALSRNAIVVAGLLCLGIVALAIVWWRSTPLELSRTKRLWVPVLALFTLWALSVAAHAVTPKYISEITAPGLVYLFYAVGVMSAAIAIVGATIAIPRKRLQNVAIIALPLICAFAVVQQGINWTLGDLMRSAYSQNADLAAMSTQGTDTEAARCAALDAWMARPWPDYYLQTVTVHLDENYDQVFGDEFCSTPAIPIPTP